MDNIKNLVKKISADVKSLQSTFITLDKNVGKLNQAVSSVSDKMSVNIGKINVKIEGVAVNIRNSTENMDRQLKEVDFSKLLDTVRNVSDAFKSLSGSGVGFEQSMANLSATTGIAGKDLEELSRVARETGIASGVGATGAAEAFALLASQTKGSKVGMEELKTLQRETITLAQAGGLSMADAATAMTDTINQFGLGADDANRVINVMAAASMQGSAGISDLSQSFKVVGSVAAGAGVSMEQTAGALEVLSQANIKGADAGAALRDIMGKLQTEMGIDLGETGLSSALEMLKPQLNDVGLLSKTFGDQNVQTAQFLIANAGAVDAMTTAITGTNVAQEQAVICTSTTAEQMKQMQAAVDDVQITLFNATGGVTAYVAAMGDSAVMIAQMMPLFSGLQSVLSILTLTNIRVAATTIASSIAQKAAAAGTWLMTAAQGALNAVMNLNPIALIVTGIAALVVGLIAAYNNCEGFRQVVDKAWEGIKRFAAIIWDHLVKAFSSFAAILTSVWDKLKALFGIETETEVATENMAQATDQLAESQGNALVPMSEFTNSLGKQGKQLNTNLDTIGGMEQKIAALRAAQKEASTEQAIALEKDIRLLEKKKYAMENAVQMGATEKSEMKRIEPPQNKGIDLKATSMTGPPRGNEGNFILDPVPVKDMAAATTEAQSKIVSFNESIWGSNSLIGNWADNATSGITRITTLFKEYGTMLKDDTLTSVQKVSGSMQAMGALMGAMGGIVDGAAGSWLSWGANILAMVAAAIPQLLTLFGIQCSLAVAGSATLLPPFNLIAIGATVAGIAAAIASIPQPKAFAAGGIVYGNTFAQVGEYPGAANNPEVIAPLSKLKQLIEPGGSGGGVYEFRLRGRDFVAVAAKYDTINNRTR